jgi:hypothetical protein
MNRDKAEINILRAGEFFIYTLWIQSQMADLIILKKNPDIVDDFISNPSRIPQVMFDERVQYWEKQFFQVKEEFETIFSGIISDDDRKDLAAIYYLRNAIAHSHVSLGRDYFLYRPARGEAQEQDIKSTLGLSPKPDQADPMILKMSFYDDDKYFFDFNRIKRLDESCFKVIAESIGIPHSRIR